MKSSTLLVLTAIFFWTPPIFAEEICTETVRTICTPVPPTCTQECFYIFEPPRCRNVCTNNPPHCTDVPTRHCVNVPDPIPVYVRPILDFNEVKDSPPEKMCDNITFSPEYRCEIVDGLRILVPISEIQTDAGLVNNPCATVTPAVGYSCKVLDGIVTIVEDFENEEDRPHLDQADACAWTTPQDGYECKIVNGKATIVPIIEDTSGDLSVPRFCTMAEFFARPECSSPEIVKANREGAVNCLTTGVEQVIACYGLGQKKD